MPTSRLHRPHAVSPVVGISTAVSLVASLLALAMALTGPALATASRLTGQITGKQIKNGSVQAKDLSSAARESLHGQQGPTSPWLPCGPGGPCAPVGPC